MQRGQGDTGDMRDSGMQGGQGTQRTQPQGAWGHGKTWDMETWVGMEHGTHRDRDLGEP